MATRTSSFNAQAFLDSAGPSKRIVKYGRAETIFSQGDWCESVMYIQQGGVKLSVLSKTGREAVDARFWSDAGTIVGTVPSRSEGRRRVDFIQEGDMAGPESPCQPTMRICRFAKPMDPSVTSFSKPFPL
jgi:CRP-like cAMP-binding protein